MTDDKTFAERVAALEAHVEWLKKVATTNLFISATELITLILLILKVVGF